MKPLEEMREKKKMKKIEKNRKNYTRANLSWLVSSRADLLTKSSHEKRKTSHEKQKQ